MKLFKTTDIEIVKYCKNIFRFELPSVRLSRSYSSVDSSVCRHILIRFCWYTLIVLLLYICLFMLYSLLPDLWWIKVIQWKSH